jgi:hypothetical protein
MLSKEAAFDIGMKLGLTKRAIDWEAALKSPYARGGAVGAGAGGLLGLLSGLTGDERPEEEDEEQPSLLSRALIGALLGGGAGVGGAGLYDLLREKATAPEMAAAPASEASSSEAPAGPELDIKGL